MRLRDLLSRKSIAGYWSHHPMAYTLDLLKRKILITFGLASLALIFPQLALAQDPLKPPPPPISDQEFRRLVDENKEISSHTVPADLIVSALQKSRSVRIKESVIEGNIVIEKGEVSFFTLADTTVKGRLSFNEITFT